MPQENPQVLIKVIPGGGTNTVDGLLGQLKYVTQERDIRELNADGLLEFHGKENPTLFLKRLREDDVEVPAEKFGDLANKWVEETAVSPGTRDLTTHLVTSFPEDTDRQAARQAALDWADEIFRSGSYAGDTYNYVYAVHRDKGHLHVHFIINRRGWNGRWLKISKSSNGLHYDTLRQVMVPHALNNGIELDATSREERGLIERPITTAEYYRRATGRVKVFDHITGVVAEGALTRLPTQPNTPDLPAATPPTSPSASLAGQTPPSGANFSPSQSDSFSRKRKWSPELENFSYSSATFEEAHRRDISDERHYDGDKTFIETPKLSSPSPSLTPSPIPHSRSAETRTKRTADAAGLEVLGAPPGKRAFVTKEAKRKSHPADLDSSFAPSPKRPRTGEPNAQENGSPSGIESPPGSGIQNHNLKQQRRPSSSQAPATGANADTNQGTGSATSSSDGPERRRRRKQHHFETNRTHTMETRALKKTKQQELDQHKRKLRSGKKYDPLPDKSRKKDDGHSV